MSSQGMNLGHLWEWGVRKLTANVTDIPLTQILGEFGNEDLGSGRSGIEQINNGNGITTNNQNHSPSVTTTESNNDEHSNKNFENKNSPNIPTEDPFANSFTIDYESQTKKRAHQLR